MRINAFTLHYLPGDEDTVAPVTEGEGEGVGGRDERAISGGKSSLRFMTAADVFAEEKPEKVLSDSWLMRDWSAILLNIYLLEDLDIFPVAPEIITERRSCPLYICKHAILRS